ncbi:MAG TPA: translocation/assembly module TamB domain-containing protein [Polyangia bacterium]|nr:translocation/assembly module TamB domain-containing protein [Polyangia bacterium]
MRALRIVAKVLGWIALVALLLVVSTLLTVVIVGRTDWGHRKILGVALPEIQDQLAGHLKIGSIGGDLTHGLVLRDVEIDDIEHQPAVRLKALTVRYDLLALARHTIDLTELRAEGAWVHARVMRDGRLNLATLAKPSNPDEAKKKQSSDGYKIRLGKVIADLEARYDAPDQTVHATARIRAHALIDHGRIDAGLEQLEVQTLAPLRAAVRGKGGATIDGSAIAAKGVDLVVDTNGQELRKLAPAVKLRGRWTVEVKANGPADRLALSVVARPPAGRLAVDATLATTAPEIAWRGTVSARGIDPAAAIAGAPRGSVRLDASAHGEGSRGTIDLKGLVAQIAGTKVDAHGTVDTAGNGTVLANVASRDLSQLRALGIRGIAGSMTAKARVERTRTHLHVDADVSAVGLAMQDNRIGKLDAHVHDEDFIGEAHVRAESVRGGGLALDTLALDASGNTKKVQATLQARGPDKLAVDLVVNGTPTLARHRGTTGRKIVGADMTIDKLAIARHGQAWTTTGPATLRVHDGVDLQKLELAEGSQHLGLGARYDARTKEVALDLRAQKLNLKNLTGLLKPSLDLPDTQLAVEVHAKGTTARPFVTASLDGYSERSQRLGLNKISYRLDAQYGNDRAKASWKLSSIDQSFHGKVDLPTVLTGSRPIAADISANNIWMVKLHKVLPPAISNVDGRLDGSIKASGTTARPVLTVDLHGRGWQLGSDSKNNDVRLKVDYKERKLNARAEVHLQQSLGKDAGALVAQVELPLDASLARLRKSQRIVDELEHKTPIEALVTLTRVDLARFPFQQLGMTPPLTAGMVDGNLKLRGTLHAPLLDVDVEAHGLARGRLDKVDLFASLDYGDKRASLKVDGSLRGAPILRVRGQVPLDVQRVLDHEPYQTTPVKVDLDVPGFNLVRVQDLVPRIEGQVNAHGELRGTIGKPTGKLDLAVNALALGAMRYDKFVANAAFDGAQATAKLDAHELKGGTLDGHAMIPVDARKPLVATLRASGFYIDIENVGLTNPRLFKGTLNAAIDAHGPRTAPTVEGFLKLADAQLALAADARIYDHIQVDVAMKNNLITLRNAEGKVQGGDIKAWGHATLASSLKPQSVELRAEAHHFPIPTGSFGAWLDATVHVQGQQTPDGMSGTVVVEKGTANLPKIAGGKKLQSTGPLEDVKFVDAKARNDEAKRKEAEQEPATAELTAHIPGPFHVRSKELSTDLAGNLQIAIAGPVTRISGQVHASGGWLELLGRRYNIEKARVGFGGEAEPNPELDVRITRELSQTRLIIEVHGTAKKPTLVLSSDPPIYDQSEVIAAILSGDPATQRVDDRSLDQKVTGAVSGLLVNKIKDQIAPNLPIDVIKVDTGTEGATGLGDTRLEVGKYITDTIYVSYVHQFGSTFVGTQRFNANEADLEWRFKKRYELETAFGDAAVGRVNLYWTIRY